MTQIHGDGEAIFALSAQLKGEATNIRARAAALVRKHGTLLQARVKRNASLPRSAARGPGTGGPRIITGDYNRSITVEFEDSETSATAVVGTNRPQGRRLEFGFVGVDSLGRSYRQPPYPHFGPAVDETEDAFVAEAQQTTGEL